MDTTKALVHRARQARIALLRTELALTLAQILFWAALIGGATGLALWARHRLTRAEPMDHADGGAARPPDSGQPGFQA
ncbi:MAG: hypothetical protein JO236_21405 [Mycobacterium sp.]|uniref:hypothetical protein n=1 Tax=Mycobacterium sp. TaxID=1785 RepID=UPI001ECEDE5E|nr:hypothetical protein [Mycobacterium sp.]MBW0020079.1 hypothetical protein [Mycobacterium sp.]